MAKDEFVEIEISSVDEPARVTSQDDTIVTEQAKVYLEIKKTQAELQNAKEMIPYHPSKWGGEVLVLQDKLQRLATTYKELGQARSANSQDDYRWSSGGVFSGSNG